VLEEDIVARLTEFFASRGQRAIPEDTISTGTKEKPDLAVTDGKTTTYLKVFRRDDLQERNTLLQVALGALSYTAVANRVYLVLPKVQAAVLDAAALRERGLGLLVYDLKTIEEVLPARLFEHGSVGTRPSADLERLRGRISALEQTVEALVSELSRIKSVKLEQLEVKGRRPETPAIAGPQRPQPLPSFLQDNPWLDILSKRGRESDQIAG